MKPTLSKVTIALVPIIIALAYGSSFGQLSKIENKLPKTVPLKVEFKNQDSEKWVHDLEIKVTNVGEKPIYYLYLLIILDVTSDKGNSRGFTFHFGDGQRLYSTEAVAKLDDPSILPNESYTFKINEDTAKAWDLLKELPHFVRPESGELILGWLSFGNGTGLEGGGKPFQKKKF